MLQKLKKTLLILPILSLIALLGYPPIATHYSAKKINELHKTLNPKLKQHDLTLELTLQKRKLNTLHYHWQLRYYAMPLIEGTLKINYGIALKNHALTIARAELFAPLAGENLNLQLNINHKLELISTLKMLAKSTSESALYAQATLKPYGKKTLNLKIENQRTRLIQNETYPPFTLNLLLESEKEQQNTTPLPRPLRLILTEQMELKLTLESPPHNKTTLQLKEQLKTPLQLPFFIKNPYPFLEDSSLIIEGTPLDPTIKKQLERLVSPITDNNKQIWHIEKGELKKIR